MSEFPGKQHNVRLTRKKTVTMKDLVPAYVKTMGLSKSLNSHRVFQAWDVASGAGRFTTKKFYRDGILFIQLDSSVVREQLYMQRREILSKLNHELDNDPLFTKEDSEVTWVVKELVLR